MGDMFSICIVQEGHALCAKHQNDLTETTLRMLHLQQFFRTQG